MERGFFLCWEFSREEKDLAAAQANLGNILNFPLPQSGLPQSGLISLLELLTPSSNMLSLYLPATLAGTLPPARNILPPALHKSALFFFSSLFVQDLGLNLQVNFIY